MSVRKRKWITRTGEAKEAWVVDYADGAGRRHLKTFQRKKEADAYAASTHVHVREGTHVADSATITVKAAGELWIRSCQNAGLERTTIDQYRQHLFLHIVPFIGKMKLSDLNGPTIRAFEDRLQEEKRSPVMIKRVIRSLGALLAEAHERGLTAKNPVRDMRKRRPRGAERQSERRQKGKLKVGTDIPISDEIKAIIAHLRGRWRPLFLTAIFTGLRASELRGLRWTDVDLNKHRVHVRQRADRYNQIGPPKSAAGEREVPLPPMVVNTLREWELACPKGQLGLVFPNGNGNVESIANIVKRGLFPAEVAAGVTVEVGDFDEEGKPIVIPKYTGMHVLRHWYASWCINAKPTGLGLQPKVVQERLGHSSITMTMDTYGHLFPRGEDVKELAEAETALFA
jgi:integrase